MANKISLDPEELKAFAHHLSAFNNSLKNDTSVMLGHLKRLGETWDDPQYQKFSEELEGNARAYLIKFDDIAEKVINDLNRKYERAIRVHEN